MTDVPKFTVKEKYAAVKRELGFRRRVYARRVELKTMTQERADFEINIFIEIASEYQAKADEDDKAGRFI